MRIGSLKLKLQIICGDGYAMGPGKADLLDAIEREGSISAAGRALGMSYRRTWLLVDEMNRCFAQKLVETLSGGGKARGARLTVFGREMLTAYRMLERQAADVTNSDAYHCIAGALLDAPRQAHAETDAAL